MDSIYEKELKRRESLFTALKTREDENGYVFPADLQELRIFKGGRGIWWDKEVTGGHFSPGATVSLLHTGRHYDDDLEDDFAFYHYPSTRQATHDKNDIESTRNVMEMQLPLFYIIERGVKREVRKAYVDMDDEKDVFLIRFGDTASPFKGETFDQMLSEPFPEIEIRIQKTGIHKVRPNQKAFSIAARKYHGTICAFCGIDVPLLLDAAHIIPFEKSGPNDPRNSLILCATHHRAYDEGLVFINPETLELINGVETISLDVAGISIRSLTHLANKPHALALQWRWENPAPYRRKK